MKLRLGLLVVVIYFIAAASHPLRAENTTILVVGDSISSAYGMDYQKGWVSLLQRRLLGLDRGYRVVNASISGDTSASGRQRISRLLERHDPEVVIIELGGNDGLRGLPLGELKSNLQHMIDASINSGAKVLLAGMKILPNYGPKYTGAFEQVYSELARDNSITLIPFILEGIGGVADKMQSDGIHPNEQAQLLILNNVWSELIELL